jgi:hypothetical protein
MKCLDSHHSKPEILKTLNNTKPTLQSMKKLDCFLSSSISLKYSKTTIIPQIKNRKL